MSKNSILTCRYCGGETRVDFRKEGAMRCGHCSAALRAPAPEPAPFMAPPPRLEPEGFTHFPIPVGSGTPKPVREKPAPRKPESSKAGKYRPENDRSEKRRASPKAKYFWKRLKKIGDKVEDVFDDIFD